MNESIILQLILVVLGFCWGGIMWSYLLPKLLLGKDVRALASDQNPGAANVFTNCGVCMGMLCLTLDLMKGFLPVFIALQWTDLRSLLVAPVMLAPILGHAIAPFNRFRGGKCISAIFGEMLALLYVTRIGLLLAGLYILSLMLFMLSSNRQKSLFTFTVFGTLSLAILLLEGRLPIGLGCAAISCVAIWKHLTAPGSKAASAGTAEEKSEEEKEATMPR